MLRQMFPARIFPAQVFSTWTRVFLLAIMPLCAHSAVSTTPIAYTVRFPAPQTHYAEVTLDVPTDGKPAIELMMAVWTPGSYLVREYARHVEHVQARSTQSDALKVEKIAKNRWRVATDGASNVKVSYRVYGREMSVRTNWIESRFALLNGAPTFLTLADGVQRPHDVRMELPSEWKRSMVSLPAAPDGKPHHYRAADFDTLVDSPMLLGNPAVYEFAVDGKPHFLVNEGEGGVWDGSRSAKDTEAIVKEQRRFWGQLPYDKYVFLNLLVEAGGGLEHKNSTTLMASRFATRTKKGYQGWLGLVSHEFFHVWNVKRLRPVELGPFNYEQEAYTRGLWVAEGLTSYYGDLLVHRAGLMPQADYLTDLSGLVEGLQITPGRLVQPVEDSSYDAWIKHYRPDENTRNTAVSYYTKGAVVGWLLDAKIRKATDGKKSLDDAMRLAYQRYSGERGYTLEEFRRLLSEVAGTDLNPWLNRALNSTEELDYSEALAWYGLRWKQPETPTETKAWLGSTHKNDAGRLLVSEVRRDTPAYAAGLNVDDEILAIDDFRVRADSLDRRLEQYRPGDQVTLLVSRRDQLMRLPVTLREEPAKKWRLEVDSTASSEQKEHLAAWLKG